MCQKSFYVYLISTLFFFLDGLPKNKQIPKKPTKLPLFFWFQWVWGEEILGFFPPFGKVASRLTFKKAGIKGGISEAATTGLTLLLWESTVKILLTDGKRIMVLSRNLWFLATCHDFISFSHEGPDLAPLATPTHFSYSNSRLSDEFNRMVFWPQCADV